MDVKRTRDENDKEMYVVTDPKFQCTFYIRRTNDGFIFYEVSLSKGNTPKELKGMFTRPTEALDALEFYIKKAPKSYSTKRKEIREVYGKKETKDAPESRSESNDKLQQGASD